MRLPDSWHSRVNQRQHSKRPARVLTPPAAALLSMLAVASGILLSIAAENWDWLARSGSLVVVIGMLLTSAQIIDNSRRLRQRRVHHDDNFHRDFAHTLRRQPQPIEEEDLWVSGLHGLYLLVTGTLLWGFGDLVGLLFESFMTWVS